MEPTQIVPHWLQGVKEEVDDLPLVVAGTAALLLKPRRLHRMKRYG